MNDNIEITLTNEENIVANLIDVEPVSINLENDVITQKQDNYEELKNLPKVNSVELKGNKSLNDLGIDQDFVKDDNYVHTDNNYTANEKNKLEGIETGANVNVQVDWEESNDSDDAYIKNKPSLGTASAKNFTTAVTSGSADLPTGDAIKTAIDNAVAGAYHHAGTKTVAELLPALLIAANEGDVYNITDSGVTTADFLEGAGKPINEGDNVGIAKVGNSYKFDLLSGLVDTSSFVEKSATSGLIKNDGSIDTNTYLTQHQDITGKADKVSNPTNNNFAGLDSSGNLIDSGKSPTDISNIFSSMATNGCKNFVNISTKTPRSSGISYTYNNDGSVTLNGTTGSSSSYVFPCTSSDTFSLEADRNYILTGVPSGAQGVNLRVRYDLGSGNVNLAIDSGEGATFRFTQAMKNAINGYHIMISVAKNTTCDNVVVKPMIRYAEVQDATFKKYAMTNDELTTKVEEILQQLS